MEYYFYIYLLIVTLVVLERIFNGGNNDKKN